MKKFYLLVTLALTLLLAACGNDTKGEVKTPASENDKNEVVTIENNDLTFTYDQAPTRAISLNQHVTEIMLALGLEEIGRASCRERV